LNEKVYYYGTGRRKTAIARVRLYPGAGPFVVNSKPIEEFFPQEQMRRILMQPLVVTNSLDKFSASIKVTGGGVAGQAGAVRHGIARALVELDQSLKPLLRSFGLVTRDPRAKESKKYGLVRARKAKQYTKR